MQLTDMSMGVVLTINDDGLYRLNDDDVTCLTKLLHERNAKRKNKSSRLVATANMDK